MNSQIFKNILIATLPIFAYIITDYIFKDIVLSIFVAVSISLIEFIVSFIKFRKIDFFIFFDLIIIVFMSLLSLFLKDPIFFKLKPAILETVIFAIIIPLAFSKKFFLGYISRYFKDTKFDEQVLNKMQKMFLIFIPILIGHIILIVISAFFFSKEVWAFVSGVLLYIIFGIVILSTFLYKYIKNKFIMKKYKDDEWFDIVDNEGKIIGKAPRTICHNGCKLLHPVVHIHIFNTHHKLLLQKRSKHKDIQPGLWDTSVGGHISSGEKLEVALRREANEELGINIAIEKLIPLSKYIFESDIEKELVFSFVYITDDKVYFQISEIDEVKFYSKKEIQSLVENGQTTKNFKLEFDLLNKPEFKKIIPF